MYKILTSKNYSVIFALFFSMIGWSQNKEFLDKDFKISNLQTASYYRIKTEDPSMGLIKYETYFKNNDSLQSKGYVNTNNPDRKSGTWQWYYSNGNKKHSCTYSRGKVVGNRISYFKDGTTSVIYKTHPYRQREMPYNYTFLKSKLGDTLINQGNGIYTGDYQGYLEDHIDSLRGPVKNELAQGKWKGFKEGKLIFEENYKDGELVNGIMFIEGKKKTYQTLFKKASPTVSTKVFYRKLIRNVRYYFEKMGLSTVDYNKNPTLRFSINEKGEAGNLKIIDGYGEGPDEAIMRGFQMLDLKWNPPTLRTLPITGTLDIPFVMQDPR
jgi:antitoxin component YwqK of YwqJK toxin-antitoxin module